MKINHLKWDSNFFNHKVGQIKAADFTQNSLSEVLKLAKQENFTLLYLFVSPANDMALSISRNLGGELVDTKITFTKAIGGEHIELSSHIQSISANSDINKDSLFQLAYSSGSYSRFKTDRNISQSKFKSLYRAWVVNSISRLIADEFLVYDSNPPKGFITAAYSQASTIIGLIGTDPIYRGKGIGRKLIQSIEYLSMKNGQGIIKVATQENNRAACLFYEKCGFSEAKKEYVIHFWLKSY